MRVFKTPNDRFAVKMGYVFAAHQKYVLGCEDAGVMALPENGKIYIYTIGGTVEVPEDSSYVRYISNTWYDDVDVQNL